VRVTHARRIDDEREIVSFSSMDSSAEDLSEALERTAEGEKQRHDRITEVIEMTVAAGIYEVIAEVELS
jgi:ferritin